MLEFLTGNPMMMLAAGWLLKEQLNKPATPAPQAPQFVAVPPNPYMPQPQGYAPPPQAYPPQGEYAAGMPVQTAPPPTPRKPLGPVALDGNLPLETEADVWKCLEDRDEDKSRRFARALAMGGYPAAAAVVAMHAHALALFKAAMADEEAKKRAAASPAPIVEDTPAPRNGAPTHP
jgi:hypothetical protein